MSASLGEEQLPPKLTDPDIEDSEIVARISGDFAGWDGKTIFKLTNRQNGIPSVTWALSLTPVTILRHDARTAVHRPDMLQLSLFDEYEV